MLMVLLLNKMNEWTAGDTTILSLDQERAYDHVERGYLRRIVEALGFGMRMRNWIRCCYSDLSEMIILNDNW